MIRSIVCTLSISLCLVASLAPASAETASALLREGDTLAGSGQVTTIGNPAANHVGGYAARINTSDDLGTLSRTWGNATGGAGAILFTQGTYAGYVQDSFESFWGFADSGASCYSATATEISSGLTSLDGAWVDAVPVLVERQAVPTLPGQYSTFNSRPGMTGDGQPYWVGGISTIQGGSTQNRVLFLGAGTTVRLQSGDVVGGVGLAVTTGGIDFDVRFSELGTHYIMEALVSGSTATDQVVVIDGNAATAFGGILREGTLVEPSAGGLPNEKWVNFDFFGIREDGLYFATGDTDAATTVDEFVLRNGKIVLREGEVLVTPDGSFTLSGAIEGGAMNKDGDWAVAWDVNTAGGSNIEALIVNGRLVLKETDSVDLDGDGTVEPNSKLVDFSGLSSLVLGAMDPSGYADAYFTATVDTQGTTSTSDDVEALFRVRVQVNRAPIASCRSITVEAGESCAAGASVDDGSSDPDGDQILLTQDPPGPYGLGSTGVTLTVTDPRGFLDTCEATVTVVPAPLVLDVGASSLSWGPAVCDVGYDVVRGCLDCLRAWGDFSLATVDCLANDVASTTIPFADDPASGSGFWFLARRVGGAGSGTYDTTSPAQVASRDAGIAASGADCP